MKTEHEKFMGSRIKDSVTGASGVVTCVSYYLNGCVRVLVEPPVDKEGKRPEAFYIDIQQAEIIDEKVAATEETKSVGGPPRTEASRY